MYIVKELIQNWSIVHFDWEQPSKPPGAAGSRKLTLGMRGPLVEPLLAAITSTQHFLWRRVSFSPFFLAGLRQLWLGNSKCGFRFSWASLWWTYSLDNVCMMILDGRSSYSSSWLKIRILLCHYVQMHENTAVKNTVNSLVTAYWWAFYVFQVPV